MFRGVFFQLAKDFLTSLNGYKFAPLGQLIERNALPVLGAIKALKGVALHKLIQRRLRLFKAWIGDVPVLDAEPVWGKYLVLFACHN